MRRPSGKTINHLELFLGRGFHLGVEPGARNRPVGPRVGRRRGGANGVDDAELFTRTPLREAEAVKAFVAARGGVVVLPGTAQSRNDVI